ncbi:hypothetical protein E1176_13715 [Fulvivirga sp. RKSG066]|uniref:YncE family protein n=1 Tax=Fulvivirga aurantia TaxID=2529383 RepID=UPI0012BD42EC|nr:DUF5074 domain-containing protein [Fulvivirga aurantia]MTI22083.1 hypothetical protein [Fulvivirga aurantia]
MKINNNPFRILSLLLFGLIFFTACSDDDRVTPSTPGEDGYFILNEGAFGAGNASLSFYDKETGTMQNDVFFKANSRDLGDQAQSMTIIDSFGYIVVQGSAKIEVINLEDYKTVTTIDTEDGLVSPRYIIEVSDNKAYVSDWGSDGLTGTVKVLDLETNDITKSIATGAGANTMVKLNDRVYVANGGGYGSDNTISVINSTTDELITNIEVGDNPKALQVDAASNLWVAGSGKIAYNADWSVNLEETTPGFLAKINTASDQVEFIVNMTEKSVGPGNLSIGPDGDMLYFNYNGGIYTANTTQEASDFQISSFIEKSFYGFGVDPSTGDFIGGEAPDFTSGGKVYQYTESGDLGDEYQVGIAPNSVIFK